MYSKSDFTKGSILRHIATLATPAAIGLFFNTLYNLVDTFFARFISTEAQSALGFSFPLFFIIIAGCAGLGQSTAALIANAIGANDKNRRQNQPDDKLLSEMDILGQSLLLSLFLSCLIMLCIYLGATPLYHYMGAGKEALHLAKSYIFIVALGTPGFILGATLNGALSAYGDTLTFGITLIIGSFLNVVLNALFVSTFGWGMWGIALSTFLIQKMSLIFIIFRFNTSKCCPAIKLHHFRPQFPLLKQAVYQSIPASFNMIFIAINILILTSFFARFGDSAVAAAIISNRITQLFLLPTIGITMALLSICGQNFGAGLHERVHSTHSMALIISLVFTVFGGIILILFGKALISFFSSDPVVLSIGGTYMYFQGLLLPAMAFANVPIALMQALKKPLFSLVFNFLRLIMVPFAILTVLIDVYGFGITSIFWGELASLWLLGLIIFFAISWFLDRILPR